MSTALDLPQNTRRLPEARYLRKDASGKITEMPEEMFWRVAEAIASVEKSYGATDSEVKETAKSFYTLMTLPEVLPNSPALMSPVRQLWLFQVRPEGV
jgi:ribonucleoside-diphosphate reductase alpha chain